MLAEIDEMLVVDTRIFDMRDERAARHHRPDAIGQPGDSPLDGSAQGNEIRRDHGVGAGDLSISGEHCATPAASIPAAIAIFRVRCDLRAGGGGGSQRAEPGRALLPAIAGISSCKGKEIFLKNIFLEP
jgi:hypothetical protein